MKKKVVEITRISRKREELDNSTEILDKVNFCCNILFQEISENVLGKVNLMKLWKFWEYMTVVYDGIEILEKKNEFS